MRAWVPGQDMPAVPAMALGVHAGREEDATGVRRSNAMRGGAAPELAAVAVRRGAALRADDNRSSLSRGLLALGGRGDLVLPQSVLDERRLAAEALAAVFGETLVGTATAVDTSVSGQGARVGAVRAKPWR